MARRAYDTASTRRRRSPALFGTAAAAALLLAACVPPEMGQTQRPPNFFVSNEIVATRDVAFAGGSTALTPVAEAQLETFLDEINPRESDRITVIGYGALGATRANGVARALREAGIPGVEVARVEGTADEVTLAVARTVHLPSACLRESNLRPVDGYPYLPPASCANEYNLARMVADPDDLHRGRRLGPAEGGTAAEAIRRYREGAILEYDIVGTSGE
jgi:pilus assembly protein CpaD